MIVLSTSKNAAASLSSGTSSAASTSARCRGGATGVDGVLVQRGLPLAALVPPKAQHAAAA